MSPCCCVRVWIVSVSFFVDFQLTIWTKALNNRTRIEYWQNCAWIGCCISVVHFAGGFWLREFDTSSSHGTDSLSDSRIRPEGSLLARARWHILQYRHMPETRAYAVCWPHDAIDRPYYAVAANCWRWGPLQLFQKVLQTYTITIRKKRHHTIVHFSGKERIDLEIRFHSLEKCITNTARDGATHVNEMLNNLSIRSGFSSRHLCANYYLWNRK